MEGRKVYHFYGQKSNKKKDLMLHDLKKSTAVKLMFTTYATGSLGHNFQMFSMAVFLDRHWNPQV
jgi:SNF2 family DNA or RNA helicase